MPTPVASFTATRVDGPTPLVLSSGTVQPMPGPTGVTVSFTSTSTNGGSGTLTYLWNFDVFGDFSDPTPTSTAPNVVHTFDGVGDHYVNLQVYNGSSYATSVPLVVRVNGETATSALNLDFGWTQVPGSGDPLYLQFTADTTTGIGPFTYLWDFGDGSATENINPVNNLFPAISTYSVTLTVADQGDPWWPEYTITKTVDLDPNEGPSAVIYAEYVDPTDTFTISFDGSGSTDPNSDPLTYLWDFGDGDTSTAATVVHTFAATGTYVVSLTVNDGTLTDTNTLTITISDYVDPSIIVPTDKYKEILRYSHCAYMRCILRTPDCTTYELPVVDGRLTVDRNGKTWRSADVDVAIEALGTEGRDALERITVQSGEIELRAGIEYSDGSTEELLLARMRVDSLERTDSAIARLGAFDYALMLDEHPVDPATGAKIPKGTDWRTAVRTLIEDTFTWKPCGIDDMLVVDPYTPAWPIPEQSWDNTNRLSAILEWATARDCDFFNAPDGRFILRPKKDNGVPVWNVNSGTDGVLIRSTQRFSREQQYNAVAIAFDAPDATYDSIRAFVVDNDPYSTTRWGGPFGKRVLSLSGIPCENPNDAISIARRKLKENSGATRALSLETLRNPALLPGDVILVNHPMIDGERHVIERVTHNFAKATSEIECKLARS